MSAPAKTRPEAQTGIFLALKDVVKTYGEGAAAVKALRGVSFSLERGGDMAIVGASGSGKSTMLNLLGCLDKPTSGTITVAGRDVSTLDDSELSHLRSRHIGFVFQSFNLIDSLSVMENVEVPLLYQRLPGRDRRKRGEEVLTKVGLGHRMHHVPAKLSGGERQRVAIARALVARPELILADEPTGNLDSTTGLAIMSLLDELVADGKTLILITHDETIAAGRRRRVTLADGEVVGDTGDR